MNRVSGSSIAPLDAGVPEPDLVERAEAFVESHIRPYLVDLIGLAAASGAIYGLVWGHIPFGNVATLVALAGTYLGSKLGR